MDKQQAAIIGRGKPEIPSQQSPTEAVAFAIWLDSERNKKTDSLWREKRIWAHDDACQRMYQRFNPSGAAPQAAGPVWVKATTDMPIGKIEREKLSIKYKGSPDVLIFLNGEWHWWDDLHDKHNPMIEKTYFVHAASWLTIEWLKESESGQQVFTREQVCEIALAMGNHFQDIPTLSEMKDFMNTNYPETK